MYASFSGALLVAGGASHEHLDGDTAKDANALELGDECRVAEGRVDEARRAYRDLKNFEPGATPSDVRRPSRCDAAR